MHSAKRLILVAVAGIPLMLAASAVAQADDGHKPGQNQVMNQDQIQASQQTATNNSPVTVNGKHNSVVSINVQENKNPQHQVGDWDDNQQTQQGH